MANDYYSRYADTFGRLQPLKIEMYEFYHEHALNFLPFEVHQGFRLLDLGSGTGTFFNSVIETYSVQLGRSHLAPLDGAFYNRA
ncbi:MAG: hypothetical protein OTJ97_00620 [SAR202 cluster bacterium]|nr:hypothetical protein [SAR202 cluster bacterium]